MKNKFSPKEFLRSRRPEKFSDSVQNRESILGRSLLEYHLDTLTSRNQDTEFELFALALAKKTICPNLRPQTGPTGGGDAKVDTETFPVAEQLSMAWFVGNGSEAATERWAFAFSAKKVWKPKVDSDIKKLSETKRDYRKAFFISNQFISDRNRSQKEDELSQKYQIDVRILDRTWILDQVFTGGFELLAIEELGIDVPTKVLITTGRVDSQRSEELAELEQGIKEQIESGSMGPQIASDCLDTVLLGRALEVPDTQLNGLFLRAQRMAEKYGTSHQILEVAYQQAWTVYWWKEDYEQFCDLYSNVEILSLSSENAQALQLLHNLWFILFTGDKMGVVKGDKVKLNARTIRLAKSLTQMSERVDMPNGSLQARAMLLIQQLAMTIPNTTEIVFDELTKVVEESEGLIGFPLDSIMETLIEIGQFFPANPQYESLFELILKVSSKRNGEITSGKMLLERGIQHAADGRFIESIRSVGRCLTLFSKEETCDDLILALYISGHSYSQVGLFWAARGSFLNAASLIIGRFNHQGDLTYLGSQCFDAIKRMELTVGRIPQLLLAHRLDVCWRGSLIQGSLNIDLTEQDHIFDLTVGILMLSATLEQLKQLTKLPDIFEQLGLFRARTALLHALGNETNWQSIIGDGMESEHDFFLMWRHQPASREIASMPNLYNNDLAMLESNLLGCHIKIKTVIDCSCVEFSETLMAALEAMLATGMREKVFAMESRALVDVQLDEASQYPFDFSLDDSDGIPLYKVRCPSVKTDSMSRDNQALYKNKLCEFCLHVFIRVWRTKDFEGATERLFGEERSIERALSFTGSIVTSRNVFGGDYNVSIEEWLKGDLSEFPLNRESPWDARGAEKLDLGKWISDQKTEKPFLDNFDSLRHSDFKTKSLIRIVLWDRATWVGVGFFLVPDRKVIPIFGLLFKNRESSAAIFKGLVEDVGAENEGSKLRITVVKGVSRDNPYAYRVVIGYNPEKLFGNGGGSFAMMNRNHTMEPRNGLNLENFLKVYDACGSFILAHGIIGDDFAAPELELENSIRMKHLTVREAWTIGINDIDCMAIHSDDMPIVPKGQNDVPVFGLLEWLRGEKS